MSEPAIRDVLKAVSSTDTLIGSIVDRIVRQPVERGDFNIPALQGVLDELVTRKLVVSKSAPDGTLYRKIPRAMEQLQNQLAIEAKADQTVNYVAE